jgi:hypothetical protein
MSMGSFSQVIAEHLELQRRNCALEPTMPIAQYRHTATPISLLPDQPTQPISVHEILNNDPASWWEEQEGAGQKFNWT